MEAAGHRACAALARASRGQLCGLAADAIALQGAVEEQQLEVLQGLCDEELRGDALAVVGRLSDCAGAETLAALQGGWRTGGV